MICSDRSKPLTSQWPVWKLHRQVRQLWMLEVESWIRILPDKLLQLLDSRLYQLALFFSRASDIPLFQPFDLLLLNCCKAGCWQDRADNSVNSIHAFIQRS